MPKTLDDPYQGQHLPHHCGVEGAGRLIEQQRLRFHHQATADGDALLLAAGEHLRPDVGAGSNRPMGRASAASGGIREAQVVHLGKQVEHLTSD